jgi:hypothetical protein
MLAPGLAHDLGQVAQDRLDVQAARVRDAGA